RRITLKAFADSSPGLSFGNPGEHAFISGRRNSEGVASKFSWLSGRNSFRVATNLSWASLTQGFKANPGLELANAFSVTGYSLRFHTVGSGEVRRLPIADF